jgi:hypothetical protein
MYHHPKRLYIDGIPPSAVHKYTFCFIHIISRGKKELQGDCWRRNKDAVRATGGYAAPEGPV